MVIGTALDMGGGMFDALNSLRKAIEASGDKLQKASLALGKTFEQTNAEITPAMEGLRGSLDQRIGAAIAGLEAGLQGNTAGVAKLINQQQLTGTAFGNTANVMASLSQSLNVNNADINSLSENLIETAGTYSVSTDKLVNAVDALKDTFPTQQLAGMGTQVTEAMMSLTAQMPAMAGQVTSVMKTILDPSLKTEANLARLGIAGVRERLAAAKDAKSAEAILVDAIRTAGGNITDFVSGDFFASIGIATSVFGENAAAMAAINNQLDKRIKNEERAMDFGDTIKAIRDSIMVPLERVLQTNFYPAIKDISKVIGAMAEIFAEAFADFIDNVDLGVGSVVSFTNSIVVGAQHLSTAIEAVVNFFIDLSNTTIPRIQAALMSFVVKLNRLWVVGGFMDEKEFLNKDEREAFDKSGRGYENYRQHLIDKAIERETTAQLGTVAHVKFADGLNEKMAQWIVDSGEIQSRIARSTERTAAATEAVNDKTLDPFGDTADSYLANTAMQMQTIMGSILGQTPQDQLEETNNILQAILGTSQNRGFNSSTPSLGLGR
jgi:hypothetical protein